MKKLLTLLAIGGMTLALAACGKESEKEPDGSGTENEGTEAETQPTPDDNVEPEKTDSLSIENVYWYSASETYECITLFKDGVAYSKQYNTIGELPGEGTVKLSLLGDYELKNTTVNGGEIEIDLSGYPLSTSYTLSGDSCTINNPWGDVTMVNFTTTKYKNLTFVLIDGN